MKAILLERNPMVRRYIARFMRCAGFELVVLDGPEQVRQALEGAALLASDTFDSEVIVDAVQQNPELQTILWTAEPMDRALRFVADEPRMNNILGRPNFDSPPRAWELLMVLRRLARPEEGGPKFAWFLDWGFSGFQERIETTASKDRLVKKVHEFAVLMGARTRTAEFATEVAHELLMNAMYDAPVDDNGAPKYALNRKADLRLTEGEQPTLKIASDGSKLCMQVTDPFGGFARKRLFSGLARGLDGGQLDTSFGGAGLGLTVIHNNTAALFIDVIKGQRTEVTCMFEMDTQHRDFRLQPKSLHYFCREL